MRRWHPHHDLCQPFSTFFDEGYAKANHDRAQHDHAQNAPEHKAVLIVAWHSKIAEVQWWLSEIPGEMTGTRQTFNVGSSSFDTSASRASNARLRSTPQR